MAMKLESDLYLPVKHFLEQQGYEVKGEVKDCDLMAVREEDILIVELKLHFNLTLVLQGVERLKLTPNVFLAIERPRDTFTKVAASHRTMPPVRIGTPDSGRQRNA